MHTVKMEFCGHHLLPAFKELSKITHNTGEGATAALCMFVMLWRDSNPEVSLEEIADAARCMILSYEDGPMGEQ